MTLIDDYKQEEQKLLKSFRPVWGYSLLATICMLAMPAYMFSIYDGVLQSRNLYTLYGMLAFALVMLVAYGFFDSVRQRVLVRAAVQMEKNMAGLLLAGELARQSDANTQSIRDLTTIRQLAASPAMSAIFDLPMLPLFIFVLFGIHWALGVVVIIGALIIIMLGVWAERSTSFQNNEHMTAAVASSKKLEMHLASQELVRSQGLYRESVKDWGSAHSVQLTKFISSSNVVAIFGAMSKSVRQIMQVLLITTGAILVLEYNAAGAVIFASAMLGGRALQPVEQIVTSWRSLKQGYQTRQRLMKRLEDMELPVDRTKLPRPKGVISLERVAYVARPGTPPILKGISGTIAAGDSVAVIGPSGAGKTTLARIIVGYYLPNAGAVKLDGQDLKVWDPTARGLHIGYMPQTVTFFEASVRENIARLRRDDPEEWAIDAAKRAGVHELMMKLPEGYDTVIERGKFMPSGGQSQLIALARAFYGDPSVLVLDEPNASLDQEGERIFHAALGTARKAKITTIIITQRPSVLEYVDKVMLLQDGLVKQFGPKDEVMGSGNVKAVKAPPKLGASDLQEAAAKARAQQTAKDSTAAPGQAAQGPATKSQATQAQAAQKPVEKTSQPATPSDKKKEA
ncbi:MAG: type I secretion system permease/ATPase [Kordiimonadaceae bacterium]|nr:type I secretion system permease/ATPase [Kordiimonadaceae bacterium]